MPHLHLIAFPFTGREMYRCAGTVPASMGSGMSDPLAQLVGDGDGIIVIAVLPVEFDRNTLGAPGVDTVQRLAGLPLVDSGAGVFEGPVPVSLRGIPGAGEAENVGRSAA